jgi:hypothetical protein
MSLDGKLFAILGRLWLNWPVWGGMLATMLLAQHVWVLFAPAERALPGNTSIPLSSRTGQLFGTTSSGGPATSSLDGIRPVGIFAHSTRGFAVMQTPAGQRGVGMGSEVAPGIRLVGTHTDHVILERNGAKQRVDLKVTAVTGGITPAQTVVTRPAETNTPDNAPVLEKLTPDQQRVMKQILQNNHRGLP